MKDYVVVPPELDERVMNMLGVREEEGWTGAFSRKQYPGAIPNGTRVKKVNGLPGDKHSLGAQATVLGSIQVWPWEPYGYFVEWDDSPRKAVFIVGDKIAPL